MYYYRWSREYLADPDNPNSLDNMDPNEITKRGDGKCETIREAKYNTTLECPELSRKTRWEQISDNSWGRADNKISLVITVMEITAITI